MPVIKEDIHEEEDTSQDETKRREKVTPGAGVDIFIKKKRPGAEVGKGYLVDIYEGGVKVDTIELATKKEVSKLVKQFKEKYHTDRAFQNEMQLHVTYKSKKERGEQPMASLDNVLLKQASRIRELLHRLTNPELPLKVRGAQEDAVLESDISSVPETPAPEGVTEDKESIKRYISDEIIKKFVAFVLEKAQMVDENETDEISNPLRGWYQKLKDTIENYNKISYENFDRIKVAETVLTEEDLKDITSDTGKILTSRDPNLISQNTGMQVTEEDAELIAEIAETNIGRPGEAEKGGLEGGNPEETKKEPEEGDMPKAASHDNVIDKLGEFTRQIQTVGSAKSIADIAKDLDIKDEREILKKMHSVLEDKGNLNECQAAAKQWIEEELQIGETYIQKIESRSEEFWKYASNVKGVSTIEDVFIDWVEKENLSIKEVTDIWNKIGQDVLDAFELDREKEATEERHSIGDYLIESEGFPAIRGYIEWDKVGGRLISVTGSDIGYNVVKDVMSRFMYINDEEEAFRRVSEALETLAGQEAMSSFAKIVLATSRETRHIKITINERDSVGGNPINRRSYFYEVAPYGEEIEPVEEVALF